MSFLFSLSLFPSISLSPLLFHCDSNTLPLLLFILSILTYITTSFSLNVKNHFQSINQFQHQSSNFFSSFSLSLSLSLSFPLSSLTSCFDELSRYFQIQIHSWSEARRAHTWRGVVEGTIDTPTRGGSCLVALNLAHNQFTCVPQALACNAPNLTRLNMAYNSLR